MKNPKSIQLNMALTHNKRRIKCHFVDTGAPHVVVFLEDLRGPMDLNQVNVHGLGKWLRYHRRFRPEGVNVNVVETHSDNSLRIRTYERGVEDETLACGTGSIAAAVIASRVRGLESPIRIVPKSGHELLVLFKRRGAHFSDIILVGPTAVTFEGSIEANI